MRVTLPLLRAGFGLESAVLAWVVFAPGSMHACDATTFLPWLFCAHAPIVHYAENLLLLVPTALFIAALWPRMARLRIAFGMLVLTCTIELMQRWIPGRDSDVYDVLTNALGSWLALAGLELRRRRVSLGLRRSA